jgi:hypothetical protein
MAKSRIRLFNQGRSARSVSPAVDGNAAAPDTVVAKDRSALFNQLALLLLLLTPLVLVSYLLIFIYPQIPINPFRPITVVQPIKIVPTAVLTPTVTATPTRTPHPTNTPTETAVPSPSATTSPTASPTISSSIKITGTRAPATVPPPTVPTVLGKPTATRSPFNYTVELAYQKAQLVYTANWQGMAGYVFDPSGKHQQNITVHAWGDAPLGAAGQDVLSGAFADRYGPSGWEFTLGDKLTSGTWHVQLVDDKGNPLSEVVDVVMQGDPRANLAFIIFRQNH